MIRAVYESLVLIFRKIVGILYEAEIDGEQLIEDVDESFLEFHDVPRLYIKRTMKEVMKLREFEI